MGHAELTLHDQGPARTISLDEYWMPFTPNREFKAEPRMVVRAEGVHYWNERGERVIDAASGLFCCAAGHGRREIADAVGRQLAELDFIAPFLRGHPKSFEFAQRIAELTPGDLNRVFFVNSGSEAVDTAMKIALAFHRAQGQGERTMFVSRERAYHGVNFGGTALSGLVNNRRRFGPALPGVVHMRHTLLPENRFTPGEGEHGVELADDLTRFVNLYGAENIAACFVEPIAGSTGCLVPPRGYLARLREICDRHGILLVFDEVITGFGRTGQAFAAQSFGVTPDMITMAKALTNGAQPMGAVAVSERIHDAIFGAAPDGAIELFHGYTYSGHPAACAAGIATLDIYRREGLFERARERSPRFLGAMFALADVSVVADIRGYGMMAAIELHPDAAPGRRGHEFQKRLFDNGLHLKTTGDAAIVAPPLVATDGHIDEIAAILRRTLRQL
ncbi:MAG TPA: aminotransferase class III-fold pyridoxal phosphate-dependent enzyme [Casimicrobiaceae bacterium]|nr:aminotransferase class III-fold pyridoxal phosphate-dependent enzyme [Casimicrobiaceae bacterium]